MKTYCKDVSIVDEDLVRIAIKDCLRKPKKQTRRDVLAMLAEMTNRSPSSLRQEIETVGLMQMDDVINTVVQQCIKELKEKRLILKPIWYSFRYDSSSQKWREIGIQDAKQQLFDYIAVYALNPILKRVGEFQCASVPGRGQSYGVKSINRWLKNPRIKYAIKCDIRKCYPSIDREKLMNWIKTRVKNPDLIWLIQTLIGTFREGLVIGSYLSQWLCNLYLSQVYHLIKEDLCKYRRGVRIPFVTHALFYMDDILLLGTSRGDLSKAFTQVEKKISELGLTIKPSWRKWQLGSSEFIDMMGMRIFRDHVTIRQRIFVRIRRSFTRAKKAIGTHKPINLKEAQRCVSYYGQIKGSNSYKFARKYRILKTVSMAKGVIRNETKNVHRRTDARSDDSDVRQYDANPALS